MVPRKFNIVEFGGFDLADQYGEALPGIYDKIVDAHWNCVYIMCFGLKFGGLEIAPQYMTPELFSDHIMLNGIISIDQNDVITIPGIDPPVPPPPEPVIIPLSVTENGTYDLTSGVDGYGPIIVDVQGGSVEPSLPAEFQEVEYITFDGNEYMLVENLPTDYLIHVLASNSVSAGESCVIGYRESSSNDADFEVRFQSGSFNVWGRSGSYTSQAFTTYPTGSALNVIRELMCSCLNHNRGKFLVGKYSIISSDVPFKGNLYVLRLYPGRVAGVMQSFTPIRKFVPCYRKADDEVGLYEVYTNVFYANEGAGTLIAGPDVN